MECTLEAVNRHEDKEKNKNTINDEEQKRVLVEAYKAAYSEAVRAGYTADEAKNYAKAKAAEALSVFRSSQAKTAGGYL